jgi:hypothetical protein
VNRKQKLIGQIIKLIRERAGPWVGEMSLADFKQAIEEALAGGRRRKRK